MSEAKAQGAINQGCLDQMFNGQKMQPIVQCLQIKPFHATENKPDRYRVVLSDIDYYAQGMLATQANFHIQNGSLKRGGLIKLLNFNASNVKGKRILIILELEVLEEYGEHEKLGAPVPFKSEEEESKGQPGAIQGTEFYGKPQVKTEQPQRAMPSHPRASSLAHANIYPIEALSPYANKWTIKARCTNKSDIKTWHNRNGEGKLFSVTLLDESGEIRGTGFNDQCDTLYELFQENSVYYISSPCGVKIAKKQFSNVNNDYELSFERDTQVEKAEEQDGVPQVRFNFKNIADLQEVQKDTTVDVVAILKEVGETNQITSKTTSKPYDKRELLLVDQSGYSVRLTIWGKSATTFDVPLDSVVAFKGVKVSDFGGRSLSLLSSGSMNVNPDIDESHRLRGWYDAQGRNENFETHANLQGGANMTGSTRANEQKTISQIKDEQLGMNEEADYFTLHAAILFLKQESFAYPACTTPKCGKKVTEVAEGQWQCERCDISHPKPEYRYVLQANVSDHTGQLWVSAFNESGALMMSRSADDAMAAKEQDEQDDGKRLGAVFQEANHRYWKLRCRAKLDTFQDQQRVRYQVLTAMPVNYVTDSARLADLIKSYHI